MPNRQQRRLQERQSKAIAKKLCLLDKSEEHRLWFQEGFNSAVKACYASIAKALHPGTDTNQLVSILQQVDSELLTYIGNDELIEETFNETGIFLDFSGTFPEDRVTCKEE